LLLATAFHALARPPLSAFIESFWLYEGDIPVHAKERRLPDGSMSLVLNLRDDCTRIYDRQNPDQFREMPGGVISGAHSTFALLDTSSTASVLGVQFKPGGAAAFLPLPAAELRDEVVSLECLWGTSAFDLREWVLEAATAAQRVHILERWLLAHLTPACAAHPAVTFALEAFRDASARPAVAAVIERIGISPPRFIQLFRDAVRLAPKQFCRIRRFQQVLYALDGDAPVRWGELAATYGYFDQAHLIHEFQAFSGLTPGAYLTSRSTHRNHVPIPS
jgi:AraC-like DNA-binding protein